MRNMSFFKTKRQMIDHTKTQTLRRGWGDELPGTVLCAIEKGQGLKKGEKVNRLGRIRIIRNEVIHLSEMRQSNVDAEGFPEMSPAEFVDMFCQNFGGEPDQVLNRITFEHIE